MNVNYPPESDEFRARIRTFLEEHLPDDWQGVGQLAGEEYWSFMASWRSTLVDNGLIAVHWPKEYGGGGFTQIEQVVMAEEFARAGAPTGVPNDGFGINLLGNTLLRWGTEEQKRHYLPRIVSGEDVWCQGYSEPNSGSDLASLSTRAERDGDEWVINGQKIWTTWGREANNVFVLCRTGTPESRHRGISFLLCPLDQPGIEMRPIRQLTGLADFNEVFFTDARCPVDNVVGGVDNGWRVAMTLLDFERGEDAAVLPIRFRATYDRLLATARDRGVTEDPVVRQKLAEMYARVAMMRWQGYRMITGWLRGDPLGAESSIFKNMWSELAQDQAEIALEVLGAAALVVDGRAPEAAFQTDDVGAPIASGAWIGERLNSLAGTIYAGSAEIQRNLIAEKVLGLPR